jgi:integrase
MSTQLTDVLRQVLTQRRAETLQQPEWSEMPPWVFCSSTGRVVEESALRSRVWIPCLTKAGLRPLRMHDLRHTYASMLIQHGESLAYVRDPAGAPQHYVDRGYLWAPGARGESTSCRSLRRERTETQHPRNQLGSGAREAVSK